MTFSITQFQNAVSTAPLSALDQNFTTFGALVPIPCAVAGTNALTLTQNAVGLVPTPAITAYTTDMLFTGIAAGTNTGPVTATIGAVGVLNVYKDTASGPVLLTGGEIVAGNAFSLQYDATLNSNAGGFHITTMSLSQVVGNATMTNLFSGNSPTLTFSATPGWSSQDQTFSITAALASSLPAIGDFVQVNPPSLLATGVNLRGYVLGVGSVSASISAATISIRLLNVASASLASNSGVYRYVAQRFVP